MHGNVFELCQDFFSPNWYAESPAADPVGPSASDLHVVRGGAANSSLLAVRSGNRHGATVDFCIGDIGFRLAMTVTPQAEEEPR